MQVWVVVKQWHGKPAEILGLYYSLEKAGKVRTEAWQAHAANGRLGPSCWIEQKTIQ